MTVNMKTTRTTQTAGGSRCPAFRTRTRTITINYHPKRADPRVR